jgi:hypothetical protein
MSRRARLVAYLTGASPRALRTPSPTVTGTYDPRLMPTAPDLPQQLRDKGAL